jgi:peptide/nickel transport system substrate-binding protein
VKKGMHMGSRRKSGRVKLVLIALTCIGLAIVLLTGCGSTGSSTGAVSTGAPTGDQPLYRIGITPVSFDTLNPFVLYYQLDAFAYLQMYPYLVQYLGDKTEAQPDLAESWTTSADGLTWTFKLRSGAVWTDGKPITAEDAAFTVNTVVRLQGGAAAMLASATPGIKSAAAPDATTLEIVCERPIAQMPAQIAFLPILPEHVWGPLAKGDGAKLKTLTNDPAKETVVVAGPFTVEKYDLKGTTIFKRVDTYYGPKPLITGFGMQAFTNADAAVQALKAGDIDTVASLPAASADVLKGDTAIQVQGFGYGPQQLAVCYSKANTRHPELLNPDVRQAISLALDRPAMISDVYRGFALEGGSVLLPAYVPQFLSASVPVIAQDVTKANQILDDLGYAKGSDGIRAANGVKMSYTLMISTPFLATEGRQAQIMKQNLAAIGIEVKQRNEDNAQFYADQFGPNGDYATFDMAINDWGAFPDPFLGLLTFTTGMRGVYNPEGYSNPQYDKLYQQQEAALDPAKRKAIIDQMSTLLQQDQAEIPLVYTQYVTAWNKKWQNVPEAGSLVGWPSYIGKDIFTNLYLQK